MVQLQIESFRIFTEAVIFLLNSKTAIKLNVNKALILIMHGAKFAIGY